MADNASSISISSRNLLPLGSILLLLSILVIILINTTLTTLPKTMPFPIKSVIVEKGDNLRKIFIRIGLTQNDYVQVLKLQEINSFLQAIHPGETINYAINHNNQLQRLIYAINDSQALTINRINNQLTANIKDIPLQPRLEVTSDIISSSLAKTIKDQHLPSSLVPQLGNIFASKIDFSRQIHDGDKFKVIYEDFYPKNNKTTPIKTGPIIAAEFINHNHIYEAIRFQDHYGHVGYYTPDGKNLQLAFLRAPVKYKRISSPFSLHRMHPIDHVIRPHYGVDLAAPKGTPIRAASDGRITFRRYNGGFGNEVIIHHSIKYSTVYAHMSRFAKNEHVNSHVKEGQIIGYVGQTGLATGPHLHYEFHVYGIPIDPMKAKLPQANPVPATDRQQFKHYTQQMLAKLNKV